MLNRKRRKRVITPGMRAVLSDYAAQCRRHPVWTTLAFAFPSLGTVLVAYVPPLVVARLVNEFSSRGRVSLDGTLPYVLAFAGSWALGEVLWRFGFHFLIKVESAGIAGLDRNAFSLLLDQDYGFHSSQPVGTVSKRAHAYSKNFERLMDVLVFDVASNVLPIAFVTVVLWGYSPWLPAILLSCLAVGVAIALPAVRRRSVLVAARHKAGSRLMGRLSDSVINAMAVKSFAREPYEKERYGEAVSDFSDRFRDAANYQNTRYDTRVAPVYVLTNVIGLVAAVYFAGELGLQAGAVVLVFSYYAQISRVLWQTSHVYRGIESSVSESAEFLAMLGPGTGDSTGGGSDGELSVDCGAIRFEGVSFGYGEGGDVLSGFDLSIMPGESVGLVGASGGGKSTITKLLLRFLEPREGRITIDGQDIAGVSAASLRSRLAYVPQEPQLFHRSIRENIAYGKPSAGQPDIERAAVLAAADEFIGRLPDGYSTPVGERGGKLSGGQRQRVAIARALLRDAPIIVLDEATSALDSESERHIQEGLLRLMAGRTSIVVAHRLSTLMHLDRIVVIDGGKVVQSGTHDELVADRDGAYCRLWSLQAGV